MTELFTAVVSIAATKRRRFFWAAWWTAPPVLDPFRKPDAADGGARTREEAKRAAEAAAQRPLSEVDPGWAAAWGRVLRGEPPFRSRPKPRQRAAPPTEPANAVREGSVAWAYGFLAVERTASDVEIRRAFRLLALATHPDRGGDEASFIAAKRAYDVALKHATRTAQRPRRKR